MSDPEICPVLPIANGKSPIDVRDSDRKLIFWGSETAYL